MRLALCLLCPGSHRQSVRQCKERSMHGFLSASCRDGTHRQSVKQYNADSCCCRLKKEHRMRFLL